MELPLVLVSISLLVVGLAWAAKPEYEGKPLNHWLSLLGEKDSKTRLEAVRALGKMGVAAKEAIPALTELLRDREKEENIRLQAAGALGKMGPEAKAAIPALTELLRHEDGAVGLVAASILGKMGLQAEATIPTLMEFLRDKEWGVRTAAATAL